MGAFIEFLEYVWYYYPNFKCTWDWFEYEMAYLDVKVRMRDGKISTGVYRKETNTHQYLDYGSYHPIHLKKGITYGQTLQLRRIFDLEEVFEEWIKKLGDTLLRREFRSNNINKQ